MIIWNGPCKDRYGNFLMPDNIVESTLVRATQTKGMFSKDASKENADNEDARLANEAKQCVNEEVE